MSAKICWTKASFECYDNNCQCSRRCSNYDTCMKISKETSDGIPPMKKCVNELLNLGYAIPLAMTDSAFVNLSYMSTQVIRLWVDGLTTEEIAEKLKCDIKCIKNHKTRIYNTFSYRLPSVNRLKTGEVFKVWAKDNLIPKLNKLEEVGVVC